MLAQLTARSLIERTDILRNGFTRQRPKVLDEAEGDAPRQPFDIRCIAQGDEWCQDIGDVHL